MGIKFRCSNGHMIHVKAFLAGRRGVCPKCGIRVEIPLRSDAVLSSGTAAGHALELDESGDIALNPAVEHGVPATEPTSQEIVNVADILGPDLAGDTSSGRFISRSKGLSSKAFTGVVLTLVALLLSIVLLFVLFGRRAPPNDANNRPTSGKPQLTREYVIGRMSK